MHGGIAPLIEQPVQRDGRHRAEPGHLLDGSRYPRPGTRRAVGEGSPAPGPAGVLDSVEAVSGCHRRGPRPASAGPLVSMGAVQPPPPPVPEGARVRGACGRSLAQKRDVRAKPGQAPPVPAILGHIPHHHAHALDLSIKWWWPLGIHLLAFVGVA